MWIRGDLHVHSSCCEDGEVSVNDVVSYAKDYCDFLAISGHCRTPEFWRAENQYKEVIAAREKYNIPIFNTGELEFPVPRHVMLLTTPDDREMELLRFCVENFCRRQGHEGLEEAMKELAYVEKHWKDNCFMVFNHPNTPDVPLDNLMKLSESSVFKVLACVDRGERRAPQTWDIGAEWDALLCAGFRISARCGSDFHNHFTLGGHDYFPGEFVQDVLQVEKNDYPDILRAYRDGNFYTTCGDLIRDPLFRVDCKNGLRKMHLAFDLNGEMEKVEVVSDGKVIAEFTDFSDRFDQEFSVPAGKYYRVRGTGKMRQRKYTEGEFEPVFLLNPIYF